MPVKYRHAPSRSARRRDSRVLRQGLPAVLIVLLFALAGAAAARVFPDSFRSTAVVLVTPTGLPDSPESRAFPRTESTLNLETEAEMVLSADVVRTAADRAGDHRELPAVRRDLLVSVPDNTTVLRITADRPAPEPAQRLAQAFADAYLSRRRAAAEQLRTTDEDALKKEIATLTSALAKVSRQVPDDDALDTQAYAQARQRVLIDQLGTARNSLDQLTATHVGGGSVLSAASRPARRSLSPHRLAGPAALVLGLVVALTLIAWRSRRDRLVRSVRDAERLTGALLIGFPEATPSAVSSQQLELLGQDVSQVLPETGAVLLVVGTGPACAELLTGLAAGLAAAGSRVALVCADFTDASTALALGVPADRPGLAEALLGSVAAPPEYPLPRVRLVPPGNLGPAGPELLAGRAMAELIDQVKADSDLVLLQTPPAEAGLAARLCDTAVFFVEIGRTGRAELAAVAGLLRAGNTQVAGTVCLSPVRSARRRPSPPRAGLAVART